MNDTPSSEPLVSVVLPTYKRAHVLPHAIRSVLGQTYSNLELIIVDDNSPDDTPAVVDGFANPRIRYVRNDSNLNLPGALNRGFSLAGGAYLTWTSDDNLYLPGAIERMTDVLRDSTCDLVYADYFLFSDLNEAGHPVDPRPDRLPGRVQLEKGNHVGACFLYARRVYEEIGDYDPELFLVEDYDYFIRVAARFEFCHIPEPLYYFRRDEETLYYSRFCEVKAADVLVRYKNGLLDPQEVLDAVVELVVRNAEGLANPALRWTHRVAKRLSFRLTRMHGAMVRSYLRWQLRDRVAEMLEGYGSKRTTFAETKTGLSDLMRSLGTIEHG